MSGNYKNTRKFSQESIKRMPVKQKPAIRPSSMNKADKLQSTHSFNPSNKNKANPDSHTYNSTNAIIKRYPDENGSLAVAEKYNQAQTYKEDLKIFNITEKFENSKKQGEKRLLEQKLQKKWTKISDNFSYYSMDVAHKFRKYVYQGVAVSFKGVIWKKVLKVPELISFVGSTKYNEWKEAALKNSDDIILQIDKDVQRTFKRHLLFADSYGTRQSSLFNLLVTYSHVDEQIRYTQGMNELAALLIMHMTEEEAFWSFVMLMNCSNCKMRYLYADHFPLLSILNKFLYKVTKMKFPVLVNHLEKTGYDIPLISTKWFLCLFVQNFSLEVVLRLWDILLYEGTYILVVIAFTLLAHFKDAILTSDMEQISELFKLTEFEQSYNLDTMLQDIKRNASDFKRTGLKKELEKSILSCTTQNPSTIKEIVKEFESKEISFKLKHETIGHATGSYIESDIVSVVETNNSLFYINEAQFKSNSLENTDSGDRSLKDDLKNYPPYPPIVAPQPSTKYSDFEKNLQDYIVKNFEEMNKKTTISKSIRSSVASNSFDILQLMKKNIEPADVAKLIKTFYKKTSLP